MGFKEITPLKPQTPGTGVRVSQNSRTGITISMDPEVWQRLGDDVATVTVMIDADPAYPRARILANPDGPFKLGKSPLGDGRIVRIGRRPEFAEAPFPATACLWEATAITWEATAMAAAGNTVIDIDLPRELRLTSTTVTRAAPSTSSAQPRGKNITVGGKVTA